MTAGLILAAGAGTRFGSAPKQLAELGGRPLLQWAIDAQCAVDHVTLHPIVLVLGASADTVRRGIDPGRARVVTCERWREGQSASLRAGLDALGATDVPVLVTLGDVPFLDAETIARFAREPAPVRATCDGRPAHPVVLGERELAALADNAGDRGARGLLTAIRTVELADRCDLAAADVDTPEDLAALRHRLAEHGS